jgi:hypothetical protein
MVVTNAISSESSPVVSGPAPLPQSLAQFIQDSPISQVRSPQTGPPLLLEDEEELLLDDDAALLLEDEELVDVSPPLDDDAAPLLDDVLPAPPLPLDC